ncbi:MAG TPA: ATP-binding protein [Thermomicrobiales bacterium]|nr:ATP-binding protein [Thermomicrobiales bacterium]
MSDASTALDPRLVESEERYRAVIENASDMIQSIRPDGSFEFVNKAWLDKLGFTMEEVPGLIIWDIIHSDSVDHCSLLFTQALNGAPIENMTAIFKTKSGEPVPVEGSVTSRYVGDKIVATHGFFRDISERLRAEELEKQNAKLELEQQARFLEKMAALGKLSAGLSHELNNPAAAAQRASGRLAESMTKRDELMIQLTEAGLQPDHWRAINHVLREVGMAPAERGAQDPLAVSALETAIEEWLDDHEVDDPWDIAPGFVQAGITVDRLDALAAQLPEDAICPVMVWGSETLTVQELIDIIVRSSHRISELVSAVKGYSHMDRATEQEVDIHEGLDSTLIILGHELKQVTVTRDYDRSIPPVQVFGNTLNQVWTNIIDNAVDATDGRGTITIRTRQQNGNAIVEIADNGTGISPQDITCIFEPFFTTKPQGAGTGLGLDTAWRIVTEEHGGKLEVESEPGHTVFRVTIPLAHTHARLAKPSPSAA